MSWNDAVAYAKWLSDETGREYRLPTEAEWKYAARAGITTAYWWGDGAPYEYANYGSDSYGPQTQGRDQWPYTAPVGSFSANPWELHDTAGDIWEWSRSDWIDSSYNGAERMCSTSGISGRRTYRGGGWSSHPNRGRSAHRGGGDAM